MDEIDSRGGAEFLKRRFGDRATDVEFLGSGAWSSAYAFRLDGEPLVIRFGAYAEDFEKDRLMWTSYGRTLPIPEVLEVGPMPGAVPVPAVQAPGAGFFAISRRAYGTFLDELSGAEMAEALPSLLAMLRALRAYDVPGPGYGGFDADGRAPFADWPSELLCVAVDEPGGRVSGWRRRLAESSLGIEPFDTGVAALRELSAGLPIGPRRVVHSDLLHRNVLVRSGEVTAIFDWANAMYGDGLFDLAWLTYWWPWYPSWSSIDIHEAIAPDLAAAGSPAEVRRRMLCSEIRIGLEHMAYNAYTGNWAEVERNTRRTLDLL